jgi:hypothetical protein
MIFSSIHEMFNMIDVNTNDEKIEHGKRNCKLFLLGTFLWIVIFILAWNFKLGVFGPRKIWTDSIIYMEFGFYYLLIFSLWLIFTDLILGEIFFWEVNEDLGEEVFDYDQKNTSIKRKTFYQKMHKIIHYRFYLPNHQFNLLNHLFKLHRYRKYRKELNICFYQMKIHRSSRKSRKRSKKSCSRKRSKRSRSRRSKRRSNHFGYSHDQGPQLYNAHMQDGILLADNSFSDAGNPLVRALISGSG